MNEAAFSTQVIDLLLRFDWQWVHYRPARTGRTYIDKDGVEKEVWNTPLQGHPGLQDFLATRPPRLIFIEAKGDGGRETPAERRWRELLEQCPQVETYLWYPAKPGLERMVEILR